MSKTLLVIAALAILAAPASAQIVAGSDSFSYSDGALVTVGAPRWTGSGSGIDVVGGEVAITYTGQTAAANWVLATPYAPSSGIILIGCKIRMSDPTPDVAKNLFELDVTGTGPDTVFWNGPAGGAANPPANRIRGRDDSGGQTALWGGPISQTSWDDLLIQIDTSADTAEFFYNGGSLGTVGYVDNDVAVLAFYHDTNDGDGTYYFDDLWYGTVVPEPSSLLAMSVFGLGMLGYIKRRR